MKLVINASPVIFLVKLDIINYLTLLFEELIIPKGVENEIARHEDDAKEWLSGKGKTYIKNVTNIPNYISAWDLGAGESEVITYAKEHNNCIAALDDKAARNCAYSLNVKVIGTIGLILLMNKHNLITDVEDKLKELRNLGFRINDDLYYHAIELAKKQ